MIEYIYVNNVKIKSDNLIVAEWNRIGLNISITFNTLKHLQNTDKQEIKLYTYLHSYIRKEKLTTQLFGSIEKKEIILLNRLLSVSGIGAKNAINIMSNADFEKILSAIIENKPDYFKNVPGIGKKTANRIILELREKLEKEFGYIKSHYKDDNIDESTLQILFQTLFGMGATKKEIDGVIEILQKENKIESNSVEELIKKSLKLLGNQI